MTKLSYPRTILEFQKQFSTEEDCIRYLIKSRWPDGFICPVCSDTEYYYISTRRVLKCKLNGHHTYLTADTIMHGTRQSLQLWFWAAYLVTTHTNGISAIQLQRQLGIERYETAFNMLHKFRASMVNPEREKIGSVVEIDETYVGGPTTGGKRGRGTKKAIVIIAVERKDNDKAGRIRLRKINNVTEKSVVKFIQDSVKKGSTVITDEFKSYKNLSKYGYKHLQIEGSNVEKSSLPLAHIAISNMKSWLKGVFHGVSKKHLQAYLNEYVFRFNRRHYPMSGFKSLLGLSSQVDFPTYKGLYEGTWEHPNPKERVN